MLLNSKNILEFYCQNSTWVFINPKSDADNKLWIKRYPVPHSIFLLRAFNWLWEVQWRVKSRSSFQLSAAARSCHRFWVVKECCCWCSLFPEKTRKIVGLLVGNLETMQISACVCVCVCFHFRNRHRHHFSGASDPWPELMHFRVLSLRHAFWWCQGQVCIDANQSSWQLIATDLRATASWKLLLLLLSLNIFAVGGSSSGDLYGQRKLLRVTSLYRQTF